MNLAWRKAVRDSRLDTTAKTVAFVLDSYADRNGLCWPSRRTIARGAGLGGRDVKTDPNANLRPVDEALRRLRSAGFLTVAKGGGGRTSNTYRLTIPEAARDAPSAGVFAASAAGHQKRREVAADDIRTGSKESVNQPVKPPGPAGGERPTQEPANELYFEGAEYQKLQRELSTLLPSIDP